jgi:hypothetical protein
MYQYSLGLTNLPRIGFTHVKSRIKTIRRCEQGAVDVKWRVLDFTLLWQTALKCVPRITAPRYFDRELPRGKYSYRGLPQSRV